MTNHSGSPRNVPGTALRDPLPREPLYPGKLKQLATPVEWGCQAQVAGLGRQGLSSRPLILQRLARVVLMAAVTRGRDQAESCTTSLGRGSTLAHHHFCHILLIKASHKAKPDEWRRTTASPLSGRNCKASLRGAWLWGPRVEKGASFVICHRRESRAVISPADL